MTQLHRLISTLTACLLIGLTATAAPSQKFTLVVDAGHGGKDVGALGSYSKEKDINLSVALAFGKLVESNMPDVRVIYTRKTDVFIPLMERANIANRNKADLFVSVHTNALPGGRQAFGLETYTLGMHRAGDNLDVAKRENAVILIEKDYRQRYQGFDPNSSESYIMFELMQDKNMANSVEMAKMVQREVCRVADRPDKGVHQAGFLVLRETSMPSILIELGFITTPDEERLLNDNARVAKIAQGIYQAFAGYRNKYDRRIVVPFKTAGEPETELPAPIAEQLAKTTTTTPSGRTPEKPNDQDRKNDRTPSETTPPQTEKAKPDTLPTKPTAEKTPRQEDKEPGETLRRENPTVRESVKTQDNDTSGSRTENGQPLFMVQILTSTRSLSPADPRLTGLGQPTIIQEGNLFKYAVGASKTYAEANATRKTLLERYPDAFVIAVVDGKRIDIATAMRMLKK